MVSPWGNNTPTCLHWLSSWRSDVNTLAQRMAGEQRPYGQSWPGTDLHASIMLLIITTSRLGYVVPPHLLCNLSHGTSYSPCPQGLLTLRLALLQTQWQNPKAYVI